MKPFKTEATAKPLNEEPTSGYLLKTYARIVLTAIKHARANASDAHALFFLFASPLFYILGLKRVKSPFGISNVQDRQTLRCFTYGFFKTYFFYKRYLSASFSDSLFPVIVDIGANIGDFALGMAPLGTQIIAVEPAKESFKALKTNLQINNISNVIVLNVAVHEREEMLYLKGNASDMYVTKENNGQLVKGMPLDLIIQGYGIEKIDLLKIDVQGHELAALLGMQCLLEGKCIKLLIVEVHTKRGVQTETVRSFLESYGYSLIHRDNYLFNQPHLYFAFSKNRKIQNCRT